MQKVVRFGAQLAEVPEEVINQLQKRMDEHGYIGQVVAKKRFTRGDRVLITDGPMRNMQGIFDCELSGRERVRILLDTVAFSGCGYRSESHGSAIRLEVGRMELQAL